MSGFNLGSYEAPEYLRGDDEALSRFCHLWSVDLGFPLNNPVLDVLLAPGANNFKFHRVLDNAVKRRFIPELGKRVAMDELEYARSFVKMTEALQEIVGGELVDMPDQVLDLVGGDRRKKPVDTSYAEDDEPVGQQPDPLAEVDMTEAPGILREPAEDPGDPGDDDGAFEPPVPAATVSLDEVTEALLDRGVIHDADDADTVRKILHEQFGTARLTDPAPDTRIRRPGDRDPRRNEDGSRDWPENPVRFTSALTVRDDAMPAVARASGKESYLTGELDGSSTRQVKGVNSALLDALVGHVTGRLEYVGLKFSHGVSASAVVNAVLALVTGFHDGDDTVGNEYDEAVFEVISDSADASANVEILRMLRKALKGQQVIHDQTKRVRATGDDTNSLLWSVFLSQSTMLADQLHMASIPPGAVLSDVHADADSVVELAGHIDTQARQVRKAGVDRKGRSANRLR